MELGPLSLTQPPPLTPSPASLDMKGKWAATPLAPGSKCTKTYNTKWEADPLLKTWITRHPRDVGKVVCRFCQSVIRAHKNDLLEHTRTLKHQRNFMQNSSPDVYNQFVMELNELRKEGASMTKKRVGGPGTPSASPTVLGSLSMAGAMQGVFLGGLGSNGLGDEDVLDGEDLWNEGDDFMSAESPSDLVSVILEEQQSPNSNSTSASTGSGLNSGGLGAPTSATPAAPAPAPPPPQPPPFIGLIKDEDLPFTSADVITAIEEGYFTLHELLTIAKVSSAAAETQFASMVHGDPDESEGASVPPNNHEAASPPISSPQTPNTHSKRKRKKAI